MHRLAPTAQAPRRQGAGAPRRWHATAHPPADRERTT
nr:MAG TPA: hypothetical protein [Caudoviricetes sp.]